ncbi:MAG: repair protein RadA [Deltaproteobacteria bacterium]|nr:repair protein RadA [Deltaproteobacteria bacterium]
MAKARSSYSCTECGAHHARWLGRCPSCGGWSTLVEHSDAPAPRGAEFLASSPGLAPSTKPIALRDVASGGTPRLHTGIAELDRVLGGGLVPGSVILLGGEPGIGKSTLGLQLAASVQARGATVLYVSGEESVEQIRLRAERLPTLPEEMVLLAETRAEAIAEPWRATSPALVLVDSIQTLQTERVESAAGSVGQVRECAALLAAAAKATGATVVLIGHVTKDGALAGPRVLEHLVDVVLMFEGDRGHSYRVLRAIKNRFGSTLEVGVFSMGESGLEGVGNPSELFLAERRAGAIGSCVVPLLEGTRPILLEVQSLVAPASYGTARRTAIGFDEGRLALLLAVLARRGGVDALNCDVYLNATGGVRIVDPAADLGVALAIASSRLDLPLPPDAAAIGEIGLGGEVRRVARLESRVREAARLGFKRILVPASEQSERAASRGPAKSSRLDAMARTSGAQLVPVDGVADAVAWLQDSGGAESPR